jgi:hypothetical protein
VVLLLIFYIRVGYITSERMDEELVEEAGEFVEAMRSSGVPGVIEQIRIEESVEAPGLVFLRLLSSQGEVLTTTDAEPWGGPIPLDQERIRQQTRKSGSYFETIELENHPYPMRTIYQAIGTDVVMQVGFSLEDSEVYLDIFRQLLLLILAPVVLLSAVVGWFMATQALSDVDVVSRTAEEISRGKFNKRVNGLPFYWDNCSVGVTRTKHLVLSARR